MSWSCVQCGTTRELSEFPEPCSCGGRALLFVGADPDEHGTLVPTEPLEPRLGVATLPDPEPEP